MCVSMSTPEAEYADMEQRVKEGMLENAVLSFLRPRAVFGFVKYYVVLHEDSQGGKALAEYPLHCNRNIHDRRKVALHSRLGDDERGLGHTRRFRMVACSSPEETSLTHVSKRHRHTLMILGDDK